MDSKYIFCSIHIKYYTLFVELLQAIFSIFWIVLSRYMFAIEYSIIRIIYAYLTLTVFIASIYGILFLEREKTLIPSLILRLLDSITILITIPFTILYIDESAKVKAYCYDGTIIGYSPILYGGILGLWDIMMFIFDIISFLIIYNCYHYIKKKRERIIHIERGPPNYEEAMREHYENSRNMRSIITTEV